jgi:hypothetical protein
MLLPVAAIWPTLLMPFATWKAYEGTTFYASLPGCSGEGEPQVRASADAETVKCEREFVVR